ncbi:hypothetical protein WJX72_009465 [[Myrmecia] bisecta]|uniref:Uncharacterized protein n=1 Tax=[Myrmecia] bisecta TaxID=41462 RepID=A0AAW1PB40_9CHLO
MASSLPTAGDLGLDLRMPDAAFVIARLPKKPEPEASRELPSLATPAMVRALQQALRPTPIPMEAVDAKNGESDSYSAWKACLQTAAAGSTKPRLAAGHVSPGVAGGYAGGAKVEGNGLLRDPQAPCHVTKQDVLRQQTEFAEIWRSPEKQAKEDDGRRFGAQQTGTNDRNAGAAVL